MSNNNNVNNENNVEKKKRQINYENRIVLDFSEEEMKEIKEMMEKEHLPYKKTMVYVMVKRYMDIYNKESKEN